MPSVDEIARRQLWLGQRALRIAKRQSLEMALAGDPLAAAAVRAGVQPLIDRKLDWEQPVEPEGDDSLIVKNHDLNL